MKKIGFLSFGHWSASRQSVTRSARDVLQQFIELAVAAEELGADGAYFRVHHFAQQLASPFPLLAAIGARTSRIEIGTGGPIRGSSDCRVSVEESGVPAEAAGHQHRNGLERAQHSRRVVPLPRTHVERIIRADRAPVRVGELECRCGAAATRDAREREYCDEAGCLPQEHYPPFAYDAMILALS